MKKSITKKSMLAAFAAFITLLLSSPGALYAQSITENFDDITLLAGNGWFMQNNSSPLGTTNWEQGGGTFNANSGAAKSYIGAGVNNTGTTGTINNWLLTPNRTFRNGDVITFYTRKTSPDTRADKLEVRLSTNGASTNVGSPTVGTGDFTTLLLNVNPFLEVNGTFSYPTTWTQYTITISGLPAPTSGRVAFRYYVTSSGTGGTNGESIGIDNFVYTPYVCPTITLSPATGALPGGSAGTAYSNSLTQTGALGAPNFAITAGAVPPGMTLSTAGTISGTPTATGTFNFTVTASDNSGCSGSSLYSITIVCPANPISFVGLPALCSNDVPYTLIQGSPAGGSYSGTGVSGGMFDPTAGTQNITYDLTDPYGCAHSSTATITVNSLPTVTAAALDAVCKGSDDITLSFGSPAGGTYSGVSVTSGIFTPAKPGTTSITYSYTDANGCTATASSDIIVNDLPNVTASALNAVCKGSSDITLAFGSPAGGTYSGVSVTSGIFTPAKPGTTSISYSYTDANGCTATASSDIIVYDLPTVTVAALDAVCKGSSDITLAFGSPAGGTYSGVSVASGIFTPAKPGTTTITYSYTDANGCSASASSDITVNDLPTVTTAALDAVCKGSDDITLSFGSPAGGTYSGTNVTSGVFTPSNAETSTITYSYTDANGCSAIASSDIVVNDLPTITTAALDAVCKGSDDITLSFGSPAGGTYSGTSVASGVFTPAKPGTTTITYSYTDVNGCTATASSDIIVNDLPTVTASALSDICEGSQNVTLDFGVPAGGTYSGTNVTVGVFTPSTAGTTSITYSYTDINGCTATASSDITVTICTGITNSSTSGIKCYPNPSTGVIVVEFEQKNGADVLAQIIDAKGKVIVQDKQNFSGNYSKTFDLSSYPKGMYTVSLCTDNKITYYKLIVQ